MVHSNIDERLGCVRRCSAWHRGMAAAAPLALAFGALSSPANAQSAGSTAAEAQEVADAGGVEPVCTVWSEAEPLDGAAAGVPVTAAGAGQMNVLAGCGGRGFLLGTADSYEVAAHRRSGAVVVVLARGLERQVWLFSADASGAVLREDVTGDLALGAGRGVMSGLRDVTVNLARFAGSGVIGLNPSGREGARSAQANQLAWDDRLAERRGNGAGATNE